MSTSIPAHLRALTSVPWAIKEDRVAMLESLIESNADAEAIMAALGGPKRKIQLRGGVAVLPIAGAITQKGEYFGTSTERLRAQVGQALANPDIGAIVFDVDSPGGSVSGVPELAEFIYKSRGKKPMVAVVNSLMASAAYWIGSAADEVVIAPSGEAGSIGVFMLHVDASKALEEFGVKVSIIRAGKYKAEGNPFEPLTDDARAHMQDGVNEYYGQFVDAVAAHRGVTGGEVAAGYGQGRALTARKAVQAGLADRVGTLGSVLAEMGVDPSRLSGMHAEEPTTDVPFFSAGTTSTASSLLVLEWEDGSQHLVQVYPTIETAADEGGPDADADGGGTANTNESPDTETAPEEADKEEAMSEKDTAAPAGATEVRAAATADERKRVSDIYAICSQAEMSIDKAQDFIQSGASVETVRQHALDAVLQMRRNSAVRKPPVELNEREQKQYSFARAILNAQADGSTLGFEGEVDQEIRRKLGQNPDMAKRATGNGGFYVPTNIGMPKPSRPQAVLETGGSDAGEDFVFTEDGSFIDLLRNRMVTTRLGATFLPGLQGNVAFPKQTGAGTFTWRADNPGTDVGLTDLTTGQVTLTPKNGTSATSFSRQLLAQSVINVEQLVRNDLAMITARGIDLAALHGASGGDNPVGIYAATGVNSVDFGGTITWSKIVAMETEVAADNADIGTMAYASTPRVRGAGKTTQKFASTNGDPIWVGGIDGEMNGYRAFASNQLSSTLGSNSDEHGIIFGVWEHLLIGEWGAMEVLVDPYTKKRQALIEVVVFALVDVAIRYPEAFCKGVDLTVA